MSHRKERLILRTPSPGIRPLDEPTVPPPPPRPERTRQRRIRSIGTLTNFDERLASVLSADSSTATSSTAPMGSPSGMTRQSPESISPLQLREQSISPSSQSSSSSSSSSRRSYLTFLHHLYDRSDNTRPRSLSPHESPPPCSTYQSLPSWDILASPDISSSSQQQFDFYTTPISSPPSSPSQQPVSKSASPSQQPVSKSASPSQQPVSKSASISPTSSQQSTGSNTSIYTSPQQSSQYYASSSTSLSRRPSISDLGRHTKSMARQNKVASDKKKHRIPRSPRHRPISPRRSPEKRMSSPKFLRIKSTNSVTTSVGSDTSEEELDHDVKVRRLWMNRLRPRDKSNKTNTTNINSNKGKGKLIENGNKNNEKKTPSQKRNIATKTNATTTTATTTKRRYMGARRFNSTSSHEASEMVGSSKATTSSLKKDTKVYPVRHSARQIKPRKQAQG